MGIAYQLISVLFPQNRYSDAWSCSGLVTKSPDTSPKALLPHCHPTFFFRDCWDLQTSNYFPGCHDCPRDTQQQLHPAHRTKIRVAILGCPQRWQDTTYVRGSKADVDCMVVEDHHRDPPNLRRHHHRRSAGQSMCFDLWHHHRQQRRRRKSSKVQRQRRSTRRGWLFPD